MREVESRSQRRAPEESAAEKFVPIPLDSLCLDTVMSFKMYVLTEKDKEPVLYRAENLPFTEEVRKRLLKHDVERVYVESSDEEAYKDYIEFNLDKIVADDSIELHQKAGIVHSSASYLIKRLLENPWMHDGIRRTEKLAESTVDFVLRDEAAFRSFLRIRSHDYRLYTHCVNVCVFAVALAQRLGVADMSDFVVLGTGALLHDIGMSPIDKSILNKKGPLTDEEWAIVKRHPVHGIEILREAGEIPEESYLVVRQHHERCDGSGYPDGLSGEKIHRYGKVSAVVDVFDAMTSRRAYRGAVESFTAFLTMKDEMRAGLDQDVFREFVRLMAR